jgi:ubiquitin-activating enzyme E1 C
MLKSLQQVISVKTPLTPADFIPGEETLEMLTKYARVLVIGAGGLGCEILKDLSLSGFRYIEVIDMDKIDITNLNRQFLFRRSDVGEYKAEVAAKFIMTRVPGVTVKAHTQRIQDFDEDFYKSFHIIIAGLDNIEARRWLNSMLHSIVEFDDNGEAKAESVRPLIDGGTEGFKGQARLILPYKTACFECTMKMVTPQLNFPLCTIAETPRLPEHCIQYAHIIQWEKEFPDKKLDKDSPEDMQWIFQKALERAERYGIQGVTYMKTMGVVKNIIPAIASTNALISAACVLEALKVATYISKPIDNYFMYMGQTGVHTVTFTLEKDEECLVCSTKPVKISIARDKRLADFIQVLKDDNKFRMSGPAISGNNGPLYMPKPPSLEEKLRPRLEMSFVELVEKGIYSGENLVVTDPTFSKSLTFIIKLE